LQQGPESRGLLPTDIECFQKRIVSSVKTILNVLNMSLRRIENCCKILMRKVPHYNHKFYRGLQLVDTRYMMTPTRTTVEFIVYETKKYSRVYTKFLNLLHEVYFTTLTELSTCSFLLLMSGDTIINKIYVQIRGARQVRK
jgi:hypothetical protein